jgi:GNAT superfamily N-acetyltransferase
MKLRKLDTLDMGRCREILAELDEWFGIESANRSYIEELAILPAAVAELDDRVVGFISLREHNPRSVEIEVLAVSRDLHRQGAGRALLGWAVAWCEAHGVPWLHVKTRGPSTPDEFYERTRRFYLSLGFDPLFESLTLWGEADAALIFVRRISSAA